MRRYQRTFEFKNTEAEAQQFCDRMNRESSRYIRQNKPAHYTPWSSRDGKINLFACFYWW